MHCACVAYLLKPLGVFAQESDLHEEMFNIYQLISVPKAITNVYTCAHTFAIKNWQKQGATEDRWKVISGDDRPCSRLIKIHQETNKLTCVPCTCCTLMYSVFTPCDILQGPSY
jgi:hypothetical protein